MKKVVLIFVLMIVFNSCKKEKKAVENELKTEKKAVVKNQKKRIFLM